jgi:hypothetical protein
MDPCFIMSYDPVEKIRFIRVARQKYLDINCLGTHLAENIDMP